MEVVGLLNLFCLTDHPETKNIVITEKSTTSEVEEEARVADEDCESIKFKDALCIPGVLQLATSFFFIKFAMYGVYYWIPTYLEEHLDYTAE